MSDAKAAERQRRYRIREKARAQARFAGATEIPLAWFGITSAGTHFAIDADGNTLQLIVKAPPVVSTEPVSDQVTNDHTAPVEAKPKRLYPPKAMPRETYEDLVTKIRSQDRSKNSVHTQLDTVAENPEHSGNKAAKQFLALIDALPDGPEWAEHFPEYE